MMWWGQQQQQQQHDRTMKGREVTSTSCTFMYRVTTLHSSVLRFNAQRGSDNLGGTRETRDRTSERYHAFMNRQEVDAGSLRPSLVQERQKETFGTVSSSSSSSGACTPEQPSKSSRTLACTAHPHGMYRSAASLRPPSSSSRSLSSQLSREPRLSEQALAGAEAARYSNSSESRCVDPCKGCYSHPSNRE